MIDNFIRSCKSKSEPNKYLERDVLNSCRKEEPNESSRDKGISPNEISIVITDGHSNNSITFAEISGWSRRYRRQGLRILMGVSPVAD